LILDRFKGGGCHRLPAVTICHGFPTDSLASPDVFAAPPTPVLTDSLLTRFAMLWKQQIPKTSTNCWLQIHWDSNHFTGDRKKPLLQKKTHSSPKNIKTFGGGICSGLVHLPQLVLCSRWKIDPSYIF
jgi:hypothetical protein